MTELLLNEQLYHEVLASRVPQAQQFLWIVTADIKDLHVVKGRRSVPFLETLSDLVERSVSVRLIHAKEPGPRFRKDFDRYPNLIKSPLFERILCPRVHTKTILIDGKLMLQTSANLTGAGLGAKSPYRRNFESGILTDEPHLVQPMMEWIDDLYLGNPCLKCQRREVCPDPIL